MESASASTVTLSGSAAQSLLATSPSLPWPLRFAHFQPHAMTVSQALLAGTAIAICDGSYMPRRYPNLAAAAWIISTGTPFPAVCHGVTQVHGPPLAINSYRTELQGMLSLLLATSHLATLHGLSSGHLTIGCDNQGVISQALHRPSYIPGASKHADLVRAIHDTICHCPIQLSFQYVAGHQDDLTHYADLPPLAQLNVQADSMAKQALHILGHQQAPPLLAPLPGVAWTLVIAGLPVPLDPHPVIIDHLSHQCALDYWIHKGSFSVASSQLVDWPLLGSALRLRPHTFCMWVSKFASGHTAVGHNMAHWKLWPSPGCPLCQFTDETTLHVCQCPHPSRTSHWHQAVEDLRSWLTTADTCPAITRCLITTLHTRGVRSFSSSANPICFDAASAQSQIGFFNSLMGCLSPLWEQTQAVFWMTKQVRRSPHHWAQGLCLQLLHLAHSSWLDRNHLVQEQLDHRQRTTTETAIQQEFSLGISDLLPSDHFHVCPNSAFEGFSLGKVLSLPLPDQQLWLHSIQLARARGSRLSATALSSMQASFARWLLPATDPTPSD